MLSPFSLADFASCYVGNTANVSSSYYAWVRTQSYDSGWQNSDYNTGNDHYTGNQSQQAQTKPSNHYIHRNYIRKWVRETLKTKYLQTDGTYYDAMAKQYFSGPYDIGHVYGKEFWRMRNYAESLGWTQKEFNDFMNNPDLYCLQNPILNRNHSYEDKSE